MPKLKIKINNVNNLSDARYYAGMQVDCLGFNVVSSSPHYVHKQAYQEITRWINGPDLVIECEAMDKEALQAVLHQYPSPPHITQCIEVTQVGLIPFLSSIKRKVVLKKFIHGEKDLTALQTLPTKTQKAIVYCLCTGAHGWWTRHQAALHALTKSLPVLVAGNIGIQDITALHGLAVEGIALSAGEEVRVGWTSYEATRAVLEHLSAEGI